MGLFKRVSDIISANLNDMVDRFEEPEKMLNQAIREMETAIQTAMDGAARVIANGKLLQKQLTYQQRQAECRQRRAVEAVSSGDDAAARHALLRKREHEKLAAALDDELASAKSAGEKLRRQIEAMHVKLAEARRKVVTLSARKQSAELNKRLANSVHSVSVSEHAFGRFERLSEKIERAEAEAEALLELTHYDEPDLEPDLDVEAELEELKSHGNR